MTTIFGTTVPSLCPSAGRFGPFQWYIYERSRLRDGTSLYEASVKGLGLNEQVWAYGVHPYGMTVPEAARWIEDRIRGYQADLRAFLATDLT